MARVKKSGLGKGLDSLIPMGLELELTEKPISTPGKTVENPTETDEKRQPVFLKVSLIEPNRDQPRKQFDEEALAELTESVKRY